MNKKIPATIFCIIILIGIININPINAKISTNNTKSNLSIDLENNHALFVGISDYPGYQNDLPPAASDAIDTLSILTQHGWDSQNTRTLINSQATRNNITEGLSWLGEQEGTVLFYYAGHGAQVKDQDGDEKDSIFPKDEAIVPWEATAETLILDDELKTIFNSFKAEKIVCIFVSCFSGGIIEDDDGDSAKSKTLFTKLIDLFPRLSRFFSKSLIRNSFTDSIKTSEEDDYVMYQPMEELQAANRVIMTASQENKETYSFQLIGQPFAEMIIQALKGGLLGGSTVDKNNDGFVSAEEAFAYAQPRATLEAATALGAPVAVIGAIRSWIKGEVTIFSVLYVCAAYSLVIPVPQISDSDSNQEILLTKI